MACVSPLYSTTLATTNVTVCRAHCHPRATRPRRAPRRQRAQRQRRPRRPRPRLEIHACQIHARMVRRALPRARLHIFASARHATRVQFAPCTMILARLTIARMAANAPGSLTSTSVRTHAIVRPELWDRTV